MRQDQLTIGRGELHYARFKPGTKQPMGFTYMGNTPEWAVNIETEELQHFSSDRGIREEDASVPLEVTRQGTVVTDNISPENQALFLFGENTTLAQPAVPAQDEDFASIVRGLSYKVGVSEFNPVGYMGISNVTVTADPDGAATALVLGEDYTVNEIMGTISIRDAAPNVATGDDIRVNYEVRSSTRDRIVSGNTSIECALLYISNNPEGPKRHWMFPWVKISPNGDFNFKSDEWQQLPLAVKVLKLNGVEAMYVDGEPVFA